MGFSRQESRSGLLFPSPGHLPDPGMEPLSAALSDRFFTTAPPSDKSSGPCGSLGKQRSGRARLGPAHSVRKQIWIQFSFVFIWSFGHGQVITIEDLPSHQLPLSSEALKFSGEQTLVNKTWKGLFFFFFFSWITLLSCLFTAGLNLWLHVATSD